MPNYYTSKFGIDIGKIEIVKNNKIVNYYYGALKNGLPNGKCELLDVNKKLIFKGIMRSEIKKNGEIRLIYNKKYKGGNGDNSNDSIDWDEDGDWGDDEPVQEVSKTVTVFRVDPDPDVECTKYNRDEKKRFFKKTFIKFLKLKDGTNLLKNPEILFQYLDNFCAYVLDRDSIPFGFRNSLDNCLYEEGNGVCMSNALSVIYYFSDKYTDFFKKQYNIAVENILSMITAETINLQDKDKENKPTLYFLRTMLQYYVNIVKPNPFEGLYLQMLQKEIDKIFFANNQYEFVEANNIPNARLTTFDISKSKEIGHSHSSNPSLWNSVQLGGLMINNTDESAHTFVILKKNNRWYIVDDDRMGHLISLDNLEKIISGERQICLSFGEIVITQKKESKYIERCDIIRPNGEQRNDPISYILIDGDYLIEDF